MGTKKQHQGEMLESVRAHLHEAAGWVHLRKEPRLRELRSAVEELTSLVEDLIEPPNPDKETG